MVTNFRQSKISWRACTDQLQTHMSQLQTCSKTKLSSSFAQPKKEYGEVVTQIWTKNVKLEPCQLPLKNI